MPSTEEMLEEARARVKLLSDRLPDTVDPASVSVTAKIPYKVLLYREALIWRTEELGRCACDSYERRAVVAATLLTRAVMENAAAIWYLKDLLEKRLSSGLKKDLDTTIMRLLMGHKIAQSMPDPIHVMDFIRMIDKTMPGIKESYDEMSEFCHPNWAGTTATYAEPDHDRCLTNLAREPRSDDRIAQAGMHSLLGALCVFEAAYDQIADMMPKLIAVCEADLAEKS